MKKSLLNYFNKNKVDEDLMSFIRESIAKIINKNIYYKKTLIGIFGNYDSIVDEMTNEVFIKLKEKKDVLSELVNMNGKIEGYLYTLIRNYIADVVKTGRINVSLNETDDEGNEKIDFIPFTSNCDDAKSKFIAEMIYEELKENFDEKKLCYFLYKMMYKEELFFLDKSNDARYKIIQRTKEKLRKFVEKNGFGKKEFEISIKIYMSEICEKIRNNSRIENS